MSAREILSWLVDSLDHSSGALLLDLQGGQIFEAHFPTSRSVKLDISEDVRRRFLPWPFAALEDRMRRRRGLASPSAAPWEEVQISSRQLLYFAKTISDSRAAVVLIAGRSTNVGMTWVRLRGACARMEQLAIGASGNA